MMAKDTASYLATESYQLLIGLALQVQRKADQQFYFPTI
jgi:hypothetical protein